MQSSYKREVKGNTQMNMIRKVFPGQKAIKLTP